MHKRKRIYKYSRVNDNTVIHNCITVEGQLVYVTDSFIIFSDGSTETILDRSEIQIETPDEFDFTRITLSKKLAIEKGLE